MVCVHCASTASTRAKRQWQQKQRVAFLVDAVDAVDAKKHAYSSEGIFLMTAMALLDELRTKGVHLTVAGEHVAVDAPKGVLSEALRKAIRQHKQELLALLVPTTPTHAAAATELSPQEACPQQEHISPPPYPGRAVGAPFRPGHQVWLYRWDNHTPRFDAPVTIVQMRTLWPGEQDIGWRDAAGALSWHNARLAVAVETPEGRSPSPSARQA